jgi:hypothetical protein
LRIPVVRYSSCVAPKTWAASDAAHRSCTGDRTLGVARLLGDGPRSGW